MSLRLTALHSWALSEDQVVQDIRVERHDEEKADHRDEIEDHDGVAALHYVDKLEGDRRERIKAKGDAVGNIASRGSTTKRHHRSCTQRGRRGITPRTLANCVPPFLFIKSTLSAKSSLHSVVARSCQSSSL